jgi:hypothetical protein
MKPYGSAASLWRDRQQICADKQNRIIRALPGLLRRPEFRWWSIDPGTDLPTVIGLVPPDFETAIGCDLVWAMSVFFLNERVGYRRWSAGAIGFLGVLIVLRPGFRPLSIGHLGALFAGLGGAVSVVAFRAARGKEKNISLFGAGILGGVIVCGLLTFPGFTPPSVGSVGEIGWLRVARRSSERVDDVGCTSGSGSVYRPDAV